MSRNTGQINPAGFQSLKYMYYTHVIMTIKWFLTFDFDFDECKQNHIRLLKLLIACGAAGLRLIISLALMFILFDHTI